MNFRKEPPSAAGDGSAWISRSPIPAGIFRVVLLLCGPLFFAAPVQAVSPLSVDVLVGFNGRFKAGHWTPVQIIVDNRGPRIEGVLRLEVVRGDAYRSSIERIHLERPLLLPRDSTKRYSFTVPVEDAYRPLNLKLLHGGQIAFSEEIDLRGGEIVERLILALSRDVSLDFLGLLAPAVPGRMDPNRIRVIYPRIEFLPVSAGGYDGVEAVIVHNAGGLTDIQAEALERWVASGGTLIVSGGDHLPAAGALESLLPVRIIGQSRLEDFTSFGERFGSPLRSDEPLILTLADAADGTVLLSQGGIPLLVEESRGRGRIVFMAFDFASHPIQTWEGKFDLWRFLLPRETAPPEAETGQAESRGSGPILPMLAVPISYFPSHLVLLGICGFYLLALWLIFRRPSTVGALAKIGLAAVLSLALTGSSYSLFNRRLLKTDVLYADVTVLNTAAGRGWAEARKEIAFISALPGSYSVSIGKGGFLLDQGGADGLTVTEGDGITVGDIRVDPWRLRRFSMTSVLRFPSGGGAAIDGGLLRVAVENRSSGAIREAVWLYRGVPYFVGDIRPGEKVSEDFRMFRNAATFGEEVTIGSLFSDEDMETRMKVAILDHLLGQPEWDHSEEPDTALLIGWLDDPPAGSVPDSRFVHEYRYTVAAFILRPEDTEET